MEQTIAQFDELHLSQEKSIMKSLENDGFNKNNNFLSNLKRKNFIIIDSL